ncbi:MAG TPA: YceI family protein [Thermoanaerobaculia bacterium]|jgi:polyisoprenoid-binding protein YceI
MKRTFTLLFLALAAIAAGADRFAASKGSAVKIEGSSTLHAWTIEGHAINGEISAPSPDQWTGPANAVVTIPVASLKSEHAKMDKLMADTLKAEKFPEIRYQMTEATPQRATGDAFVMKTRGKLTVAGVTREVTMDVQGSRNADGRYTLVGEAPIRMTSFGLKPPTAMMGTIKTGDDVKVTFRWVVERAQ